MTGAASQTEFDDALALRAQRGDRQAYGELISRCRDGVVGVVYRMCGDAELAEEAAQDAFIKAWQRLDSYRPQGSFRSWMYRIAVNTALDTLRRVEERTIRAAADLEDVTLPSDDPGPEESLEQSERARLVRQAILNLSPAVRAALVLREYGGLSYAEISASLNVPLGTVMSRLNAARGELRQRLAPQLEVQ